MVPMSVAEEKKSFPLPLAELLLHQIEPKLADTRACVEDQSVPLDPDENARGVAAEGGPQVEGDTVEDLSQFETPALSRVQHL